MSKVIFSPPAPNEVTAPSIKKVPKPCSDLWQDLLAREDARASHPFDWSSNTGVILERSLQDLQRILEIYALPLPDSNPKNCSNGVTAAVAEMIVGLQALPAILGGGTSLKGDSRFGAFTLERNRWVHWMLWTRVHGEDGDFRLLGYKGTVLQIGPRPGEVVTFPSTVCGIATVCRILKDPDVRLRGSSWSADQAW